MVRRLSISALLCLLVGIFQTAAPLAAGSNKDASPCAQGTGASQQDPNVLASVDGMPITQDEVDYQIESQLAELYDRIYEIRKRSLDNLIDRKILSLEAEARGLSVEELVDIEVKPKIAPVTDDEVNKRYQALQRRRPQPNLDKNSVYQGIYRERYYRVLQAFVDRVKQSRDIQVFLEKPDRFIHDVATVDDPWKGGEQPLVTVVEFTDFQCPACARFHQTMEELLGEFQGLVKWIVRDYPLERHAAAQKAAEAAECAHEQGRYWEYGSLLFKNQDALDGENLTFYATSAGLDTEQFRQCLSSGKFIKEVLEDEADAKKAGVKGTPALFINGKRWTDLRPESVRAAIIREIRKASQGS
jgi:protein-disulfide isomerase